MTNHFDPNTVKLISSPPFYGSFDEEDDYYQVLYRPSVAVQAREMNDMQTIQQNQLSQFASTIYKNGSVVEGCSIEYISDLNWVALADTFATNSSLAQDDPSLIGAIAIGNTSGVQAYVVAAQAGFASQVPGKFFIRYTAPGANGQSTFIPGEYINVYSANTSYVEAIVVSCNSSVTPFVGSVGSVVQCVQTANTANTIATAVIQSVNTAANTITVSNVSNFFQAGQTLLLINSNTSTGISSFSYDTGNFIASINALCSGSSPYIKAPANGVLTTNASFTNASSTGSAYGASVSEGVVYQSGYFVDVNPQTIVINPFNASPANYSLGFVTSASVIDADSDPTLNDNALGYPNYNAPGASRLKLTANIVSVLTSSLTSNTTFFPIVQFSNSGAIFQQTDPTYSALGAAMAQRTYEEAGHFIVNPFAVSSNSSPYSANSITLTVQPGLAYVEGERIQLLNSLGVEDRRGTDTVDHSSVVVTTSYGSSVTVNQVMGYLPPGTTVNLFAAPQTAVTSGKTNSTVPTGTSIGQAVVRMLIQQTPVSGQPNTSYTCYLTNIDMSGNAVFSQVKSLATTTSPYAMADIVGTAAIQDADISSMVFPLGPSAVATLAANGVSNSSYYTMVPSTSTMDTTGRISFSVPAAGEELGFGVGTATQAQMQLVNISVASNVQSANIGTCSTFANGLITSTVANFGTSLFWPGDTITVPSGSYTVSAQVNSTAIQASVTTAASGVNFSRTELAGRLIPLDGITRTLTFSNTTSAFANLGINYATTANVNLQFYTLRTGAVQTAKQIHRGSVVMIVPANTAPTGPWCIGLPDVLNLNGVFIQSANGNIDDHTSDFILDNGQRDGAYNLASISLASTAAPNNYIGQNLIVSVDHFTPNNSVGSGFFDVDSYPVNDAIGADANVSIHTAEIPSYVSRGQTYNLRDCLDFRPYQLATANVTNVVSNATTNPPTTSTLDPATTGTTPFPSGNFMCNLTNYIGRKDILLLSSAGVFNIAEGNPSLTPVPPIYDANSNLAIADITVPPFPSLPSNEASLYAAAPASYDVQLSLERHKRYTMNDIARIDQRVTQLEYYVTLNTLENAAASTTTINSSGQQQLQNGIFVDPLTSHAFADTSSAAYRIAIDTDNGYARPFFVPWFVDMQFDLPSSNNVVKSGNFVSLSYTSTPHIQQSYATGSRTLTGTPPTFMGTMQVSPDFWSNIDAVAPAASIQSTGTPASTALMQMAAPPLCSEFGWWRQAVAAGSNAANTAQAASMAGATVVPGTTNEYTINDTTYVDVTVQSYIAPALIAVRCNGLKPYTNFHIYIDNIVADAWAAPGILANPSAVDATAVSATSAFGSPLVSSSRGDLYALVSIPANYFVGGSHSVTVLDTSADPVSGTFVSGAASAFAVSVVYVLPPPPPPPQPPEPPPLPAVGPAAAFKLASPASSLTTVSPTYPTLTFQDTSVAGTSAIATRSWSFGDGTTLTTSNTSPVTHTYSSMPTNTQTVSVVLTVTDAASRTSSFVQSYVLSRKVPALPPPSVAPTLSIVAMGNAGMAQPNTFFQGGSIVTESFTQTGNCGVVFNAYTSNTVAGGYWTWAVSGASGTATTNRVLNAAKANNQFWTLLVGSTANLTSSFTVTATYNGTSITPAPTVSETMTLNSSYVFVAPAPSGGGGCADIQSYTPLDKMHGTYVLGDDIKVCRHSDLAVLDRKVSRAFQSIQPCYRLKMASGATVIISSTTPLEGHDHERFLPQDATLKQLPVWIRKDVGAEPDPFWDTVMEVEFVGNRTVNRISVEGQDLCYWAGEKPNMFVSVHNLGVGGVGASGGKIPIKKF